MPSPDADAQQASRQLLERIRAGIELRGGWTGFDEYMQCALYEPGLGYYSGGARKFGPSGDFVTAPQISPLFGRTLARQCRQWFEQVPARILEFGAGTGELAAQLLGELSLESPDGGADAAITDLEYLIVEVSAELRERQQQTLSELPPQVLARVRWLDHLPESIEGVVIGNELLDAMPVRLFRVADGALFERGVCLQGDQLAFEDRPADPMFAAELEALLTQVWGPRADWPAEYVSETCVQAQAWIREIGTRLVRGAVLLIDYGFPQAEYYHQHRSAGTLMCHYRHFAHPDPFFWPGLQDITAHVNFSAVTQAAEATGLECLGYLGQARLLMNLGLLDLLARVPTDRVADYLPAVQAVKRLLTEAEMGELFKAIAFGRGLPDDAIGFLAGDRRGAL